MLGLWGMWSTPLLLCSQVHSGPLWSGVVAPDKGSIFGLDRSKPCFLHNTDFAFKLRI